MSFLRKVGYRRIIYLLVLIFAAFPMISPFGLPLDVSIQSKDLYNYINDLPPNSNIAINFAAGAGMYPDSQAATRAVLIQLFKLPVNMVLWHSGPDSPMLFNAEMKFVDTSEKTYGEDYVYLPYAGGGESTLAAIAENIRGVYSNDVKGTPLDELPLMRDINNAKDFDFILVLADCGGATEFAVRQWNIPHDIPVGGTPCSISYPDLLPFWKAGNIIGMTNGVRGGAEYELLINKPGPGLRNTDVLSSVHILFILLVIVGNLGILGEKIGGA